MRLRCLLLLPLAFILPACSGTPTRVTPPAPDPTEALQELGEVYKYRAVQKMPVPARTEDLMENDGALGTALPLIREGQLVVVWKIGYSANSSEVLAYEKDTPTTGGKVLLRNGSVKQMTAAEFAAAPKAR